MKSLLRSAYSFSPTGRIVSPVCWWPEDAPEEKREWNGETVMFGGRGAPRAVVFDFGKEVGGYVRAEWGAARGGPVALFFSEAFKYLSPFGDSVWALTDFIPGAGMHVYSGRGGERWRDPLLRGGFRYLLLRPLFPGNYEIEDIELELDFYVPEGGAYAGGFECSDPDLNRIWYAAAYTIQAATKRPTESFMLGRDTAGHGEWVIMDGAKRDRSVWAMDLAVCLPSFLLTFGDAAVTRDSLGSLLDQKDVGVFALRKGYLPHAAFPPNRITCHANAMNIFSNYVIWWIRGVHSQYLYAGDEKFAREVFGDIVEAFEWLETQARPSPQSGTPLFYADGMNDLSWDYTIRRRGFSGATNILWAVALEEAASMARFLIGDKRQASRWRARAAAIRKAVFETGFKPYDLFDNVLGRFRHTTNESAVIPLEANALAVLHDFVRGADADRLLDLLAARNRIRWGTLAHDRRLTGVFSDWHNKKVMPCLVSFEAAALMKRGRLREALDLARATWLPMLEQGTQSTFWEWYGSRGGPTNRFASLCHPWSSPILQRLTEGLSGVRPTGPGYSTFELDPAFAAADHGLKSLEFRIPTLRGAIRGRWLRKHNRTEYELECPPETTGVLKKIKGLNIQTLSGKSKSPSVKFKKRTALILARRGMPIHD